jgi:hypothetical protein
MSILAFDVAIIAVFAWSWCVHLIPFVVPVILGRKPDVRARLGLPHLWVLIVPFGTWAILMAIRPGNKGLGNATVEPVSLGCVLSYITILHMHSGFPQGRYRFPVLACVIGALLGALLWGIVPAIGE